MEMNDEIVERTSDEIEAALAAAEAERDRRVMQLRHDARAVYSAMEGWQQIGSQDDWVHACEQAFASHDSGRFLIEQLGAERYLEPQLMAVLLGLRRGLVGSDGGSAAEAMLADVAVLSYYNTLRIQQWIGDLAASIEHEFFAQDSPTARFEARYGRGTGLVVEEQLARLAEELLPLQERANRMVVRNLKALADLRRAPAPSVAIGQAGQVNVGGQQVNVTQDADHHDGSAVPVARATKRKRTNQ
jgi:hypothetical protein